MKDWTSNRVYCRHHCPEMSNKVAPPAWCKLNKSCSWIWKYGFPLHLFAQFTVKTIQDMYILPFSCRIAWSVAWQLREMLSNLKICRTIQSVLSVSSAAFLCQVCWLFYVTFGLIKLHRLLPSTEIPSSWGWDSKKVILIPTVLISFFGIHCLTLLHAI